MKKEKLEKEKEIKEVSSEKNDVKILKEGGEMKKQIITLIIGILIGAVITASIFLIVKPKNGRNIPDFSQFEKNGERVRPNGEDFDFDFSKDGRSRRSKDSTSDKKVEDKAAEETKDEGQA